MHAANAALSRLHWKVRPVPVSEKANVADVLEVGFVGPEVIVGAGGTTDQVYTVAGPVPEALTARTRNV